MSRHPYNYIALDDPFATTGTFAYGINDKGGIAGYFYDATGDAQGFIYSHGTYTTVDDPAGTQTFPEGINDKGQIVGWYNDGSGDHGFLYNRGTFTSLDDPLATVNTFAMDISDKGHIVGYYQNGLPGGGLVDHGLVYSRGIYTTLDDPFAYAPASSTGTANGTAALGVNDKDQVVGYYFDATGKTHGFLYSNGIYKTIDDPLGVNGTVATDINDQGLIVGYYYDSLNVQHGFLYSHGSYKTIDDPSGNQGTYPSSINDKGQIAGYYVEDGVQHGFLANPTGHNHTEFAEHHSWSSRGATDCDAGAGDNDIGDLQDGHLSSSQDFRGPLAHLHHDDGSFFDRERVSNIAV